MLKCIIQRMFTKLFYTNYSTIVFVIFLLAGCTQTDKIDSQPATLTLTQTRQATTITPTIPVTDTTTPSPTPVVLVSPTPTATPVIYEIKAGDTIIGIANQYKIEIEALLLANPTINPNLLSVGVTLTIPIAQESSVQTPISAIDIDLVSLDCYDQAIGSTWCIASMVNNHINSYINVSVSLSILDADGKLIENVPSSTPIINFPPDSVMPFGFYFPNGKDNQTQYSLVINTGTELSPEIGDTLWTQLPVTEQMSTQNDGSLQIDFSLNDIPNNIESIHIMCYLLNDTGKIIGYRTMQIDSPFDSSNIQDLIYIYSLGPEIHHYQIFAFGKLLTN